MLTLLQDASAFSRLGGRGATEPAAIKERKGLQAVAMSEAQPKAKRARNTDHDPKTRYFSHLYHSNNMSQAASEAMRLIAKPCGASLEKRRGKHEGGRAQKSYGMAV